MMTRLLPMLLLTLALGFAPLLHAVEAPPSCEECGMDRTSYAHSRMLITFADKSQVGTCSVACVATHLKDHPDKKVVSLQVADYATKRLIDAPGAIWVIGGNEKGVMTSVPKWAFAKRADAERFVAENGGQLATWQQAYELAQKE